MKKLLLKHIKKIFGYKDAYNLVYIILSAYGS